MRGHLYLHSLKAIPLLCAAVLFVLVSPLLFGALLYQELATEARFYRTYGSDWRVRYEEEHGSLAKAHRKIALSATGVIVVPALMIWTYRLVRSPRHSPGSHRLRSHRLAGWSFARTVLAEVIFGHFAPIIHSWSERRRGGGMSPYGFFVSLRFFFILGLWVAGTVFVIARLIGSELSTEARYRNTYGPGWQALYEQAHGSLAKAHAKIALSAAGLAAVSALLVWLYRLLRRSGHAIGSSSLGRRHRHRYGSELERAAAYRRKALLGVFPGLVGILLAVLLVIFRTGMFQDHQDQIVLAIFVFLAGYSGVIAGCSCWLKAKRCQEAIVFIGLIPLVIPMIPVVRLVLLAAPALLPVSMVMMPLILIVIVAVLPDQSGLHKRKAAWEDTPPVIPAERFHPRSR